MCIFFAIWTSTTDQDENYALGWRINLQMREIISHFFIQYIHSITVWFAALFNNIPIIFGQICSFACIQYLCLTKAECSEIRKSFANSWHRSLSQRQQPLKLISSNHYCMPLMWLAFSLKYRDDVMIYELHIFSRFSFHASSKRT